MFKGYSQKGCIFECSLKFAIEEVGCLPWDFPTPIKWENASLAVCNSHTRHTNSKNDLIRFYDAMKNDTNLKNCDCVPDCEGIIYEAQESTLLF